MAHPIILVNSATGSDTAASGAGPSTALTGTTDASTNGAGTVVTLTSGTDLTNVATDGSHVIYLVDTTAGARNFGKITAKAGSGGATPNVTVSDAFGISLTGKSWAIGGKRASVFGGTSLKLTDNNGGNGDAMPGWTIRMESAHAETTASTMTLYRSGDTTSGAITIEGVAGAATRPVITHSANSIHFQINASYWRFSGFQMKCSHATKTVSQAWSSYDRYYVQWENMILGDDTDYYYRMTTPNNNSSAGWSFVRVTFNKSAASTPLFGWNVFTEGTTFLNCMFKNAGSHGLNFTDQGGAGPTIIGCQFLNNGGYGINDNRDYGGTVRLHKCTFEDNTSGGIYYDADRPFVASNCIFSNNGGYGVEFRHGAAGSYLNPIKFYNCDFYNNTSGSVTSTFNTTDFLIDCITSNPTFVSSTDLTPTNTALQVGLQAAP